MNNTGFSSAVVSWHQQHGRKDLPWQRPITPYRVYVSEIMLQQTQVATVIPYFQRFMQAFPDVKTLAQTSLDRVLHLWTGLGYYARARNLHKTAQCLLEKYNGKFPNNVLALQKFPGIGRSTAGAICALAFKQREPILDGNVKRVLARFHGITEWPGIKTVEDKLWKLADEHLPKNNIQAYTQAMMDLGATVCTRSKPQCSQCPLQKSCFSYQKNIAEQCPGKKPKKVLPQRQVNMLILVDEKNRVLLRKRPDIGIWGGLWSLPELAEQDIHAWCLQQYACRVKATKVLPTFRHTFSHYHLDITPIQAEVMVDNLQLMESDTYLWYNPAKPEQVGLPQPIYKILHRMEICPA